MSTTTSLAQTSDSFPNHTTAEVGGIRHECFNLGGFTELLRLDAELVFLQERVEVLQARETILERQNDSFQRIIDLQDLSITDLTEERFRLHDMWAEENRKRLEAENSRPTWAIIGWTIAAGLAISTVTLAFVAAGG